MACVDGTRSMRMLPENGQDAGSPAYVFPWLLSMSTQYSSKQSTSPGAFCWTTPTKRRRGYAALLNALNNVCGHNVSRRLAMDRYSVVSDLFHDGVGGYCGCTLLSTNGTHPKSFPTNVAPPIFLEYSTYGIVPATVAVWASV